MELSITEHGADQVLHALDEWERGVANLRGPLTGLYREVVAPLLAERFAKQGPGWAPLSKPYAEWKTRHYPGKGILERTGAMRTAFSGGSGMEIVVTANSLQIDPMRVAYWRFHQTGTKKMPARPILQFDSRQVQEMTGYLEKRVAMLAGDAGLSVRAA